MVRFGVTASKKIGGAVTRNRAKRRLRALARQVLPLLGHAGWDYVLVAKPRITVLRPYSALVKDFETALRKLHESGKGR